MPGIPATVTVSFLLGGGSSTVELIRNGVTITTQALPFGGGSFTFPDARTGDTIQVDGIATSGARVDIDRPTNLPTPESFSAGPFADGFDIMA
jgi:hypothetical protein